MKTNRNEVIVLNAFFQSEKELFYLIILDPKEESLNGEPAFKQYWTERNIKNLNWSCDYGNNRVVKHKDIIYDPHNHPIIITFNANIVKFGEIVNIKITEENYSILLNTITLKKEFPTKKKFNLIACTSPLTNRARFLPEWIEYHLIIGVEHFFIYDSKSSDKSNYIYQVYIDAGLATVIEWDYYLGFEFHLQPQAQSDCLHRWGQLTNWILYTDTDEYLLPINPKQSIIDIINSVAIKSTPQIIIRLNNFAFSKEFNVNNESHLITKRFNNCIGKPNTDHTVKTLIQPQNVFVTSVHTLTLTAPWASETVEVPFDVLRINHYKASQYYREVYAEAIDYTIHRYLPELKTRLLAKGFQAE
eukprot:TRINITY_DN5851_c0_g1_i2.p1 TRINITY_DN5851_c0_g1~~TRINITY_DN5851_c0_g1_i2.p1  ORF type:complete len:360 (-),score=103.36 TRINITY_DN5851_c0_g1_i2:41-1120(-)